MILVTGATGTVGRELVAELASREARYASSHATPPPRPSAGVETVSADLGHPETLAPALAGVERVFVLATGWPGWPTRPTWSPPPGRRRRPPGQAVRADRSGRDRRGHHHRLASRRRAGRGRQRPVLDDLAARRLHVEHAGLGRHDQASGPGLRPVRLGKDRAIDPADIAAAEPRPCSRTATTADLSAQRPGADQRPRPGGALSAALGRQLGFTEIRRGRAPAHDPGRPAAPGRRRRPGHPGQRRNRPRRGDTAHRAAAHRTACPDVTATG